MFRPDTEPPKLSLRSLQFGSSRYLNFPSNWSTIEEFHRAYVAYTEKHNKPPFRHSRVPTTNANTAFAIVDLTSQPTDPLGDDLASIECILANETTQIPNIPELHQAFQPCLKVHLTDGTMLSSYSTNVSAGIMITTELLAEAVVLRALHLRGLDLAGNIGPIVTISWTSDTEPARAAVITSRLFDFGTGFTSVPAGQLHFEVGDPSPFDIHPSAAQPQCRLLESFAGSKNSSMLSAMNVFQACNSPWSFDVSPFLSSSLVGVFHLQIRALDAAGNIDACNHPTSVISMPAVAHTQVDNLGAPCIEYTFSVDLLPPTLNVTACIDCAAGDFLAFSQFRKSCQGLSVQPILDQCLFSSRTLEIRVQSTVPPRDDAWIVHECQLDSQQWFLCFNDMENITTSATPSLRTSTSRYHEKYSLISDGAHTFRIRAKSAHGLFSQVETLNWAVDATVTPAQITNSPPFVTTQSWVYFQFKSSDDDIANYICQLNRGSPFSCSNGSVLIGQPLTNVSVSSNKKHPNRQDTGWTGWINEAHPLMLDTDGGGDHEIVTCPPGLAIWRVECRTVCPLDTNDCEHLPAQDTGQRFIEPCPSTSTVPVQVKSPSTQSRAQLRCRNVDQPNGESCLDYEIRAWCGVPSNITRGVISARDDVLLFVDGVEYVHAFAANGPTIFDFPDSARVLAVKVTTWGDANSGRLKVSLPFLDKNAGDIRWHCSGDPQRWLTNITWAHPEFDASDWASSDVVQEPLSNSVNVWLSEGHSPSSQWIWASKHDKKLKQQAVFYAFCRLHLYDSVSDEDTFSSLALLDSVKHVYPSPLPDGIHNLSITAIDFLGNNQTTATQYSWRIDTTKPVLSILEEPSPNNNYAIHVTLPSQKKPFDTGRGYAVAPSVEVAVSGKILPQMHCLSPAMPCRPTLASELCLVLYQCNDAHASNITLKSVEITEDTPTATCEQQRQALGCRLGTSLPMPFESNHGPHFVSIRARDVANNIGPWLHIPYLADRTEPTSVVSLLTTNKTQYFPARKSFQDKLEGIILSRDNKGFELELSTDKSEALFYECIQHFQCLLQKSGASAGTFTNCGNGTPDCFAKISFSLILQGEQVESAFVHFVKSLGDTICRTQQRHQGKQSAMFACHIYARNMLADLQREILEAILSTVQSSLSFFNQSPEHPIQVDFPSFMMTHQFSNESTTITNKGIGDPAKGFNLLNALHNNDIDEDEQNNRLGRGNKYFSPFTAKPCLWQCLVTNQSQCSLRFFASASPSRASCFMTQSVNSHPSMEPRSRFETDLQETRIIFPQNNSVENTYNERMTLIVPLTFVLPSSSSLSYETYIQHVQALITILNSKPIQELVNAVIETYAKQKMNTSSININNTSVITLTFRLSPSHISDDILATISTNVTFAHNILQLHAPECIFIGVAPVWSSLAATGTWILGPGQNHTDNEGEMTCASRLAGLIGQVWDATSVIAGEMSNSFNITELDFEFLSQQHIVLPVNAGNNSDEQVYFSVIENIQPASTKVKLTVRPNNICSKEDLCLTPDESIASYDLNIRAVDSFQNQGPSKRYRVFWGFTSPILLWSSRPTRFSQIPPSDGLNPSLLNVTFDFFASRILPTTLRHQLVGENQALQPTYRCTLIPGRVHATTTPLLLPCKPPMMYRIISGEYMFIAEATDELGNVAAPQIYEFTVAPLVPLINATLPSRTVYHSIHDVPSIIVHGEGSPFLKCTIQWGLCPCPHACLQNTNGHSQFDSNRTVSLPCSSPVLLSTVFPKAWVEEIKNLSQLHWVSVRISESQTSSHSSLRDNTKDFSSISLQITLGADPPRVNIDESSLPPDTGPSAAIRQALYFKTQQHDVNIEEKHTFQCQLLFIPLNQIPSNAKRMYSKEEITLQVLRFGGQYWMKRFNEMVWFACSTPFRLAAPENGLYIFAVRAILHLDSQPTKPSYLAYYSASATAPSIISVSGEKFLQTKHIPSPMLKSIIAAASRLVATVRLMFVTTSDSYGDSPHTIGESTPPCLTHIRLFLLNGTLLYIDTQYSHTTSACSHALAVSVECVYRNTHFTLTNKSGGSVIPVASTMSNTSSFWLKAQFDVNTTIARLLQRSACQARLHDPTLSIYSNSSSRISFTPIELIDIQPPGSFLMGEMQDDRTDANWGQLQCCTSNMCNFFPCSNYKDGVCRYPQSEDHHLRNTGNLNRQAMASATQLLSSFSAVCDCRLAQAFVLCSSGTQLMYLSSPYATAISQRQSQHSQHSHHHHLVARWHDSLGHPGKTTSFTWPTEKLTQGIVRFGPMTVSDIETGSVLVMDDIKSTIVASTALTSSALYAELLINGTRSGSLPLVQLQENTFWEFPELSLEIVRVDIMSRISKPLSTNSHESTDILKLTNHHNIIFHHPSEAFDDLTNALKVLSLSAHVITPVISQSICDITAIYDNNADNEQLNEKWFCKPHHFNTSHHCNHVTSFGAPSALDVICEYKSACSIANRHSRIPCQVNGRPIYQSTGEHKLYLYFDTSGWIVSNQEPLLTGQTAPRNSVLARSADLAENIRTIREPWRRTNNRIISGLQFACGMKQELFY